MAHSSLDGREVAAEELGAADHLAFIAGQQRVVNAHCPSTLFLHVCSPGPQPGNSATYSGQAFPPW